MALGVAAGITLLVTLGWGIAGAANGAFSLEPRSFAAAEAADQQAETIGAVAESGRTGFTQLLGAAGAAIGATSSPTTITVVHTEVRSTLDQNQVDPDATVIHF
jgi:hypothetical protein